MPSIRELAQELAIAPMIIAQGYQELYESQDGKKRFYPSWKGSGADGKNSMTTTPWISTFPGLALTLAGITFSMIGVGLADLLRPRG